MVTDFQERLRQIREAKDRESQAKRARESAAETDRYQRLEMRFDRREKIEKIIEEFSDTFMAEVPTFERSKSFFEGKYKIEVSSDELALDPGSRVVKQFSRVTFLLDPRPEVVKATDSIQIRCKKTVRNRDLESTALVVDASEESLDLVRQFVQEQFFGFAAEYFSGTRPTSTTR